MAKGGKSKQPSHSESIAWSLTILTLALTCAAMSVLINQNQDLKQQNYQLMAERVQ